jgi:hypothetical protein
VSDATAVDQESTDPGPPQVARPVGARWSRIRGVAHDNWAFLALLAVGVTLRVVTQIAYRPALLFIDSYRYLDLLQSLNPTKSQTLGYDFLLLWPLLKVGNLLVVAAVQHVLGLGIGIAIYVVCMRYGVSRWLAVAAAAPILMDAYQLQIEQNIMSEALFEALLAAAMLVLLWHRRPSTRALIAGGLLLGFAVPVRVVALPLIAPAALFAFVSGSGGRRRLGRAAIVGVAFLLPVVGYMAYYQTQSGVWGLTTSDARALYGRAAQIADCNSLHLPAYEESLCPPEPLGKRLGVDYYAHTYPVADLVSVPSGQTLNDVVRDFSRRVFRAQPLDAIRAVTIDFLKGFRWDRTNALGDVPVERWQFQTKWPFEEHNPSAATKSWGGGPPTVVKRLASFLRGYQLSVGYTPGPALLLALLGGVLAGLGVLRARRSRLRAVCWFPSLACIAVLVSADVFEFSWRYQLPALVLAPIAGAIGFTAIFRDPEATYPAASGRHHMTG